MPFGGNPQTKTLCWKLKQAVEWGSEMSVEPVIDIKTVREAGPDDIPDLVRLAALLWPGHEPCELEADIVPDVVDRDAAFFLASDQGRAVGFSWLRLRCDYVEGTDSSPVGYLEGIFVEAGFRGRGYARALLAAGEAWALSKGCTEFGSDCELDNEESLAFHLACGFAEANRIICFAKQIG